jgi:UDP-sugar pyrophosphorylase
VHTLLHQHGIIQKWVQQRKKWVLFFQDTNALVFRAVPSALGISTQRDFDVNSICVPRKPGDAMGGMATLTNIEANVKITINVEYNQLEPLLKETWNRDGDVPDKAGYSHFPGNINVLIFKLETYLPALDATKGIVPEFVNPKYKDAHRDVFKSATRLECMMQDFPKLLPNSAKVGFSCYERWFSFSAVKNNIVDGAVKHRQGLAPETASSGEFDLFDSNIRLLQLCGVLVEQTDDGDIRDFQGIKIKEGAKVLLRPSFGVTLRELQSKVSGACRVTKRSTLVLSGERTELRDLMLDSTLVVTGEGELVEGEYVDKKYVEYKNIDPRVDDVEGMPEVIKIRGYKAAIDDEISGLFLNT